MERHHCSSISSFLHMSIDDLRAFSVKYKDFLKILNLSDAEVRELKSCDFSFVEVSLCKGSTHNVFSSCMLQCIDWAQKQSCTFPHTQHCNLQKAHILYAYYLHRQVCKNWIMSYKSDNVSKVSRTSYLQTEYQLLDGFYYFKENSLLISCLI